VRKAARDPEVKFLARRIGVGRFLSTNAVDNIVHDGNAAIRKKEKTAENVILVKN
jgi:hypothetical protein